MKILLLTQYFPPETGAPQNRLYNLALQLKQRCEKVVVLTGFPNYPSYRIFEGYKGKWYKQEMNNGLEINRSYIFVSQRKSIFFRLLNYFSFVLSSLLTGIFKAGKVDLIICESPPLFLGLTAVFLKKLKRAKLLFNVSDLWPESVEKLGIIQNRMLINLSIKLEEWIYKHSDKISGQTQGIVENIKTRFPGKPIFWLKNGVDFNKLKMRLTGKNWREENGFKSDNLLFYFGGLMGYAQGLDCIIKAASLLKAYPDIQFVMIGEGPEKDRLIHLKKELGVENVTFYPGVPASEIADIIFSIDVGIIPLKKIDLFQGAIPSKIFEILGLEKPIILGIEGEAKSIFVDKGKAGVSFEPENAEELAEKILFFRKQKEAISKMGFNGASFVKTHFDQQIIADEFWKFINA